MRLNPALSLADLVHHAGVLLAAGIGERLGGMLNQVRMSKVNRDANERALEGAEKAAFLVHQLVRTGIVQDLQKLLLRGNAVDFGDAGFGPFAIGRDQGPAVRVNLVADNQEMGLCFVHSVLGSFCARRFGRVRDASERSGTIPWRAFLPHGFCS